MVELTRIELVTSQCHCDVIPLHHSPTAGTIISAFNSFRKMQVYIRGEYLPHLFGRDDCKVVIDYRVAHLVGQDGIGYVFGRNVDRIEFIDIERLVILFRIEYPEILLVKFDPCGEYPYSDTYAFWMHVQDLFRSNEQKIQLIPYLVGHVGVFGRHAGAEIGYAILSSIRPDT